ncbi:DedA family protein [Mesobacillus harenae]|uniref:DedA family protein n=1 Tax=Mesobacillus harenae TaxID=2213203 RepID=UPI0015803A95|nr:DedA family protein [Mesobacillus harenae]
MKDWFFIFFEWLSGHGYIGIALGLMIEIIPSEIVLGYGGYLIGRNQIHFLGAFLAGVFGGTAAQLFLYWMGLYGGRPFLDKYGKYLFISKKHLDASEAWFEKYGTGMIFTARFIPVIRHAISIPAGIARMPLSRFTLYTVAAMIPWTVLFLLMGIELGEHWRDIKVYAGPVMLPIIFLAFLSAAAYYFYKTKAR